MFKMSLLNILVTSSVKNVTLNGLETHQQPLCEAHIIRFWKNNYTVSCYHPHLSVCLVFRGSGFAGVGRSLWRSVLLQSKGTWTPPLSISCDWTDLTPLAALAIRSPPKPGIMYRDCPQSQDKRINIIFWSVILSENVYCICHRHDSSNCCCQKAECFPLLFYFFLTHQLSSYFTLHRALCTSFIWTIMTPSTTHVD